jgi:leucyl/phenylalanyl-tRNA--protein transferase
MLTPEILLAAYANGIFPMAPARGSAEIKWYAPDPRAVLKLDQFHAPKRLLRSYRNLINQTLTIDQDFSAVIRACAERNDDTWINDEIITCYTALHCLGHAHSVEIWRGEELIGGLYGVVVPKIEYGVIVPGGRVFCGESMFSRARDASKLCLVKLVEWLQAQGFTHLDAQFQTEHLAQFGFQEISQLQYKQLI